MTPSQSALLHAVASCTFCQPKGDERSLHSQLLRSVYGESLGIRRQSDSPGQSDPE